MNLNNTPLFRKSYGIIKQLWDKGDIKTPSECEFMNKIEQLIWITDQIKSLMSQKIWDEDPIVIPVLTESFYHFAWRIVELSRHEENMSRIDGGCKVGRVRNSLIVHPEGDKQLAKVLPSYHYDLVKGPKLKAFFEAGYEDQGLYVNALEFEDLLVESLKSKYEDL